MSTLTTIKGNVRLEADVNEPTDRRRHPVSLGDLTLLVGGHEAHAACKNYR